MNERSRRLEADEALGREADAWVMLIASPAATTGDAAALRAWRGRSAGHEKAYREAARLRKSVLTAARRLRAQESDPTVAQPDPGDIAPPRLARRQVMTGAIAASVGGLGLFMGGRVLGVWGTAQAAEFTTRKGERRTITLAGGVRVELNTATQLSRRPDLGRQALELIQGEMMLTAPRSRGEPYLILAGGGRTIAEEGRIALRCENDAVSVTCLAGSAKVQMGATERRILPGQQIRYDDAGLGESMHVDPALITAWRSGVLVFRRARVGDVINEIARYREGRIVVTNPALADRRIDGTFHVQRIDQIFEQLRSVYGADVTRLPGGLVILT